MSGTATPGPWAIQPHFIEEEGVWIIGQRLNTDGSPLDTPTNGSVAFVSMHPTEIDAEDFTRALANARLISASPDLLAALEAVANSDMAMREEDEGYTSSIMEQVRAAILKATIPSIAGE